MVISRRSGSPLAPLKKGGTGIFVPLKKGDLGEFRSTIEYKKSSQVF